jgi:16S rRNA (guanine(1405)-N(7))-methyltransferase
MKANQLEELIDTVTSSSKYKTISRDFIKNIGLQELAKHARLKEAVKSTKNKLHQVGGAYLESKTPYATWLEQLRTAHQAGDQAEFREICTKILTAHASTQERLPVLDQFYRTIFSHLPPIDSVIDIACGFNPVAIPWMPLAKGTEYYAYDIYSDMAWFLNKFMDMTQVKGHAEARDVIHACPTQFADLALILKAIPCLEQVQKSAGLDLLNTINAKYLVVSFPIRTLGGRNKGMATNYEARFHKLMAEKHWPVKRFEFATELAFLVTNTDRHQ